MRIAIYRTFFLKRPSLFLTFIWACFSVINAQNQFQVRSAIDSTSVKIGAVINYAIQVEENKDKLVVFPEGDSFSPLEVIKSYKIDTLNQAGRYRLLKQYALTQFDSGHYTIPRQKVVIGNKTFYTDSLKVEIRDVAVDTSKQKLYGIKSLLAVEDVSETNWLEILYWVLGALAAITLVLFLLWKLAIKPKQNKEQLPAFDRAMLALKRIGGETLLEDNNYKSYYSQLTDLAKSYLDEEITDDALESTTDELIIKLSEKIKTGKVTLNKEILQKFEETLKNADYAKFAAINPTKDIAQDDAIVVKQFIQSVEKGKPELTEEERLQSEAYRLEIEEKQKKSRINTMIAAGLVVIIWAVLGFFGVKGFSKITDLVLNRSTAGLLKKEWITSSYGVPGISISTPEILTRNPIQLSPQQQQLLSGNQVYIYGELQTKFHVLLNTVSFRQDAGFTVEKGVEGVFKQIEQKGGTNILTKSEDFETLSGTKGAKVFGSFDYPIPDTEDVINFDYSILIFAEGEGAQQLFVFYEREDKKGKKVMERIINSVEINKSEE